MDENTKIETFLDSFISNGNATQEEADKVLKIFNQHWIRRLKDCKVFDIKSLEEKGIPALNLVSETSYERMFDTQYKERGIGGTTYREEAFTNFEGVDVNNTFVCECDKVQTILIIDEIQVLYKPEGASACLFGGDKFWDTVKRVLQGGGLHIVAFASYGYWGAYSGPGHLKTISPFDLDEINTWNFEDVQYSEQDAVADHLIKTNVLSDFHQEYYLRNRKLDFTSPLVHVAYLQEHLGSRTHVHTLPYPFEDFIKKVFELMSPETFKKTLCVGNDGQLLERAWQMEFYHAARQLLPKNVHISPDVGAVFASEGWVDFYVDGKHDWMIELV
ncbi:1131_t:CDS:2 [Entrophospora sp. SA101]|nr:1131_t:CDS:2 [Entrophospora sp. SA101]